MRWVDVIEIGMLLVPILIMTIAMTYVYSMCLELGIALLYTTFPPI